MTSTPPVDQWHPHGVIGLQEAFAARPPERQRLLDTFATLHMRNRLLSGMPPEDFALLATHLKEASPALGSVLQEAGEAVGNVYFPQSGMLSMVVVTEEGAGVEVAAIGREGAAGLQRGFGPRKAFARTTVQVAGKFSFIAGAEFEKAVREATR